MVNVISSFIGRPRDRETEEQWQYLLVAVRKIQSRLGFTEGMRVLWKYIEGDENSKSRIKGNEPYWIIALYKYLKCGYHSEDI